VTIPNGIDPDQYQLLQPAEAVAEFRASLGIGASPFILFLGRLNPIKGPDILLRAFSAIAERWPEHHLVLGGPDGGMLSKLQGMVLHMGLGARVHFPGFIGQTAKAAALRTADLLVIPSRSEAMSIVVLEAGACGCPTLFTDACGLVAFQARGAGCMVPIDVEQMAVALEQLLAQPQVRKAQGELLREFVMAEFLWRGQATRYSVLYEQVLRRGASDAGKSIG
jgi:glycosyltransferase involved in cell wall biosynthesis